jgi:MFS family permease
MGSRGNATSAYAMMIIGRIISGFGNAILSTSVPLYQSEISPAARRGGLVVMNHIGFIVGLSAAFWAGYGMSFWSTGKGVDLSWRLSIGVQFIPAILFVVGLPFVPESPRWLLEKGRVPEAEKCLQFLRGCEHDPEAIESELRIIKEHIEIHKAMSLTSWRALFTDRDLFARLWRVALLQFMAQMCGSTAMKYYLPANFIALGLGKQLALLAGGIESSLKVGCTIIEMFIIDRIGRRYSLILGSAIMSVALLVSLHPQN